jgi:hypothetical protein
MAKNKPSEAQVKKDVTLFIAGFTNMSPGAIKEGFVLKEPPLAFDDNKLGFLAMSLRGYVQNFNDQATILASDTRKKDQTVKGLAALAHERISK